MDDHPYKLIYIHIKLFQCLKKNVNMHVQAHVYHEMLSAFINKSTMYLYPLILL